MKSPPEALFHVSPKITKFEVKEYLTKIYSMNVVKVNTAIMLGKISFFENIVFTLWI